MVVEDRARGEREVQGVRQAGLLDNLRMQRHGELAEVVQEVMLLMLRE